MRASSQGFEPGFTSWDLIPKEISTTGGAGFGSAMDCL